MNNKNNLEDPIFSSLLQSIPFYVYWKNKESVYLGCNDHFAEVAGLNSPEEIIGRTDYDLPWANTEADWYRYCDNEVIKKGPKLNFIETQLQAKGEQKFVIASKLPLINQHNKPDGIKGFYVVINGPIHINQVYPLSKLFIKKPLDLKQKFTIEHNNEIISLSAREMECIFYLLRGHTAKEIGKVLNISFRTIEIYLQNLKIKFSCKSKSQLIAVLWEKFSVTDEGKEN